VAKRRRRRRYSLIGQEVTDDPITVAARQIRVAETPLMFTISTITSVIMYIHQVATAVPAVHTVRILGPVVVSQTPDLDRSNRTNLSDISPIGISSIEGQVATEVIINAPITIAAGLNRLRENSSPSCRR
jgi:hypothetical protein